MKIHLRSRYFAFLFPRKSSSSSSDINTTKRRSLNKKSTIPTPRVIRRSATHPVEESKKAIVKRKHSISNTPIIIKKRVKNDSPVRKTPSKQKESKTEEEEESNDDDNQNISTVAKRKLNLDLSSKL
jgi:hypothetical protein